MDGIHYKIFVRNLPYDTTEDELLFLFRHFNPSFAEVAPGKRNRSCRGYGFILFEQEKDARKAISMMDGTRFVNTGKEMEVKWCGEEARVEDQTTIEHPEKFAPRQVAVLPPKEKEEKEEQEESPRIQALYNHNELAARLWAKGERQYPSLPEPETDSAKEIGAVDVESKEMWSCCVCKACKPDAADHNDAAPIVAATITPPPPPTAIPTTAAAAPITTSVVEDIVASITKKIPIEENSRHMVDKATSPTLPDHAQTSFISKAKLCNLPATLPSFIPKAVLKIIHDPSITLEELQTLLALESKHSDDNSDPLPVQTYGLNGQLACTAFKYKDENSALVAKKALLAAAPFLFGMKSVRAFVFSSDIHSDNNQRKDAISTEKLPPSWLPWGSSFSILSSDFCTNLPVVSPPSPENNKIIPVVSPPSPENNKIIPALQPPSPENKISPVLPSSSSPQNKIIPALQTTTLSPPHLPSVPTSSSFKPLQDKNKTKAKKLPVYRFNQRNGSGFSSQNSAPAFDPGHGQGWKPPPPQTPYSSSSTPRSSPALTFLPSISPTIYTHCSIPSPVIINPYTINTAYMNSEMIPLHDLSNNVYTTNRGEANPVLQPFGSITYVHTDFVPINSISYFNCLQQYEYVNTKQDNNDQEYRYQKNIKQGNDDQEYRYQKNIKQGNDDQEYRYQKNIKQGNDDQEYRYQKPPSKKYAGSEKENSRMFRRVAEALKAEEEAKHQNGGYYQLLRDENDEEEEEIIWPTID